MALFQLIGCQVNIGGDRGSVVHYDRFNPVTYPEYLLLQVIHGGEEHVHHAMSVGWSERDGDAEYLRLEETYGEGLTRNVFPGANHMLPLGNDALLTEEEYEAGEKAKTQARDKVRTKKQQPRMELPADADQLPA